MAFGILSVLGVSVVLVGVFAVLGALLLLAFNLRLRPRNAFFVLPFVGYVGSTLLLGWGALVDAPIVTVALAGFSLITLAAFLRSARRLQGWIRRLPLLAEQAFNVRFAWALLLAVMSSALALLPAVSSSGQFGFVQSVGPDALGYAVSGQAIAIGTGPKDIEASLEEAFPDLPVELILTPLTGAVYNLSEATLQIQAEFLEGASRVGWAGPMGLLLEIFGMSSTWIVQAVLPVTALILTALIGVYGGRKARHFAPKALVYCVGSVVGSVLLYSWHQGGAGQVWAAPAFLGIALAVSGAIAKRLSILLGSLSVAAVAATYPDGIALALAVSGCLAFFSLVRAIPAGALKRMVMVFSIGLVLFAPVLFRLPQTLVVRSIDSTQAGWQVPTSLSLPSLLGFTPLLESAEQGPLETDVSLQRSETAVQLLLPIFVIVVWFMVVAWWNRRKWDAWLSSGLSALLVLALVFLLTQVLGELRNYLLVKSAALMAPLILGGLVFGLEWRSVRPAWNLARIRPIGSTKGVVAAWMLAVVAVVLLVTSTTKWVIDYRATAIYHDALSGLEYSRTATEVINKYTFVLPDDALGAWNLATVGNFSYASRSPVKAYAPSGGVRPIALAESVAAISDLIRSGENSENSVAETDIGSESLVFLESSDSIFEGRSGAENCRIAGILLAATGRDPIFGCDLSQPDSGAVYLGSATAGPGFKAQQPCVADAFLTSFSLGMLLGTGFQLEPSPLLSSGDKPNAFRMTLGEDGIVRLQQVGSASNPIGIGVLDSSRSNFIQLHVDGGRVVASVNGRESVTDWPAAFSCSEWEILEGENRTWDPPPISVLISQAK